MRLKDRLRSSRAPQGGAKVVIADLNRKAPTLAVPTKGGADLSVVHINAESEILERHPCVRAPM